jgi:Flp pilus assembly protein TadD
MKCNVCGFNNPIESKSCSICGSTLKSSESPSVVKRLSFSWKPVAVVLPIMVFSVAFFFYTHEQKIPAQVEKESTPATVKNNPPSEYSIATTQDALKESEDEKKAVQDALRRSENEKRALQEALKKAEDEKKATATEAEELAKYNAKNALDEANKQINIVWNATTKKIREAILPAQKEWLKKRENACGLKALSEEPNNSVLQESIKLSCMAAMTDERTEVLKQQIASLQRFDSQTQTQTEAAPASAEQHVQKMLQGAINNDEISIQASKQYLEKQPKPAKGDKKAARKINEEALKFISTQQYDQALPLFAKATQKDPSDVEILNNYGFVLMKSRDLDRALLVLIKTLTMKPDRASAWANLADVLALQGHVDLATAGYMNTYRFSGNREKTLAIFRDPQKHEDSPYVREALANAIQKITP